MKIDVINRHEEVKMKTVPLKEVYRLIAGHSNYHGDNILSALTCVAEGKEVRPIKPIDYGSMRAKGEWKKIGIHKIICTNCKEEPVYANFEGYILTKSCPNCGADMRGESK